MAEEREILKEELETFEQHRDKLLKEHQGKFVLIKGRKVIDTFESERDALKEGYRRFGGKPFLIKQVLQFDPPLDFTLNILGGCLASTD